MTRFWIVAGGALAVGAAVHVWRAHKERQRRRVAAFLGQYYAPPEPSWQEED